MALDVVATKNSYVVRRSSRARRSRLTITEAGAVVVVLPARAPLRVADELVAQHREWIERHSARLAERRLALAMRPSLAFGRTLTINGRPELVMATSVEQRAALERRLRREARGVISERVAARSAEMGIAYARVTIRDQRTRWGSASRSGTLSFSWRLILVPVEVLDYVVVHELAHLRVAGHGPSFWTFVGQHHSSVGAARRWLSEHHSEVRHALD